MRGSRMLLLVCMTIAGVAAGARPSPPTAVSVFRDNADDLKVYSAVLAASEPLRLQRDEVSEPLAASCAQSLGDQSGCEPADATGPQSPRWELESSSHLGVSSD